MSSDKPIMKMNMFLYTNVQMLNMQQNRFINAKKPAILKLGAFNNNRYGTLIMQGNFKCSSCSGK